MGEPAGSHRHPPPRERADKAAALAVGDGGDDPALRPDIWALVRLVLQCFSSSLAAMCAPGERRKEGQYGPQPA